MFSAVSLARLPYPFLQFPVHGFKNSRYRNEHCYVVLLQVLCNVLYTIAVTIDAPACSIYRSPTVFSKVWCSGSNDRCVSLSPISIMVEIDVTLAARLAWDSMTPFDVLVVPEVNSSTDNFSCRWRHQQTTCPRTQEASFPFRSSQAS